MIIKSMSRRSNTGQLFSYIFRYIFDETKKEVVETEPEPAIKTSRADIRFITEEFWNGNVNYEKESDALSPHDKVVFDTFFGASIRIGKTNPLIKDLAQREDIRGQELKSTCFRMAPGYILARQGNNERVYKLSIPTLFSQKELASKSKEKPFIIRHNIRSRTLPGYIREFEKAESNRIHKRSNNVQVYHTVLSFSNLDKKHITDALLKDVAEKFIQLRGNKNLYCGTKHEDKNHVHLHLAMSGVDLTGKASRISKAEFKQLKISLDTYQKEKYAELIHSLPDHEKKKSRTTAKEEVQKNIKNGRTTKKATLMEVLDTILSKSKSSDQFIAELREAGHEPYYRSDKLQGVKFEGAMKYRFSRLGIDLGNLQTLDQLKAKEDHQLEELKALRAGKSRMQEKSQDRLASLNDKEPTIENDKSDLQELEDIRDSKQSENERDDDHDDHDINSDKEPDSDSSEDEDDENETTSSNDDDESEDDSDDDEK